MTKNKWTVRLILLVTIILAGLIILFNIKEISVDGMSSIALFFLKR